MKTIILAAAVAAFEFAFLASIASPPSAGARVGHRGPGPGRRPPSRWRSGAGAPVPCTPRG